MLTREQQKKEKAMTQRSEVRRTDNSKLGRIVLNGAGRPTSTDVEPQSKPRQAKFKSITKKTKKD